jgi:hypothetical protein
MYVMYTLHFGLVFCDAVRYETFTLCCFTLCSNILPEVGRRLHAHVVVSRACHMGGQLKGQSYEIMNIFFLFRPPLAREWLGADSKVYFLRILS